MPDDPRAIPAQSVVYDVGELLDKISTRLDQGVGRIETKLDGKADKVDLARLDTRLNEHQRQITDLQSSQRERDVANEALKSAQVETSTKSQTRWNYAFAVMALVFTAALVLVGVFHP